MSRIITRSELHHLGYEELRSLFNKISAELVQSQPGTIERRAALSSLDNIQRAMAQRLATARPRPPGL